MEENLKKKKNTLKTKLVIIIFLAIMILSCSENNPTEPSSNGYWKQYLFEDPYNNFVTNGLAIDNQFYCTGMNGISMFTDFETNPQMKYIWYISTGYDSKPIISKKYTAFFKESSETNIGFSNYFTQDGNVTSVSPASFGEQFKDYKFSFITTKREFGAINNQNRFVTTISNRSGMVADTTYIVYADFDFNDGISISNTGFWEIPSMISTPINEKAFKSYNGKFYISYSREFSPNNYFIEISENGEIKEYINHFGASYEHGVMSFFEYKGYLCAQKGDFEMIYSSDGENWQHMASLEPLISDFKEIGNYLFIYLNDKIYCLGDNINELKLYQIPTENITGRTISSINKFNDELIITTSNGIFHKSFSEIMKDKELIRGIN